MMLPFVLQACAPAVPGRLAEVGRALGAAGGSIEDSAGAAIEAVERLCAEIGLPKSLREIGIEREQLPRIAQLAAGAKRLVGIAPAAADQELLERILVSAFEGDRRLLS
jgi:alcohol dehydrogenase class IV